MRPIALAICGLLVPAAALAGWPSDPSQNLPVCTANAVQWQNRVVSDGSGGAIVTWLDQRDSPSEFSYGSVYTQRVDDAGQPQWTTGGVGVFVNSTDYVNFDAACADGASGAFLAWVNSSEGNEVHVQHVASDGARSWGPAGITVGVGATYAGICGLISDGASGVIVVWRSQEGNAYTFGVRAQHLHADGTMAWDPSGVVVRAPGPEPPSAASLVPDGEGGVLAMWTQITPDASSWKIVFQHVLSQGSLATAPAGLVVRSGTLTMPSIASASDGAHGAYVAWAEKDGSGTWRLYAQRVSPGATLLWASPALLASGAYYALGELQMIRAAAQDAIVGWKQSEAAGTWVMAQRLDPTGVAEWATGGVGVCRPRNSDMVYVQMATDGLDGALFAYEDATFTPQWTVLFDIAAARVTGAGAAPWGPTGVAVSNAVGPQSSPVLVSDGGGGAIVAFRDGRWGSTTAEGDDIYAQNVHGDGTIGGIVTAVEPGVSATGVRAWPLPARDHVELAFASSGGSATVSIFDPTGRRIRQLMHGAVTAGETRLRWDGFESSGARAPSGLYFAEISVAGRRTFQRIVLTR